MRPYADLEYGLDPQGRLRFPGIYSGVVTDVKDPLGKGRIKVRVPQITGGDVTGWAKPVHGSIAQYNMPYGTFYTAADQFVSGANTETIVSGWIEDDANNTYVSGTKIYVKETGDYNFFFSAMVTKTNASSGEIDIWIKKNGSNLSNSNSRITLSGSSAESLLSVGFILDLKAGDYVQLAFSSPATTAKIVYHSASTSPTRPAIPGIIATINLVGKFVPKVGAGVWIMFIAGDPEFPVWIGVQ
jgi:hypothetical protein